MPRHPPAWRCQSSGTPESGDAGFRYGRDEPQAKRMVFQTTHTVRVSRMVVFQDITLMSVRALSSQAEMEASHKDPTALPVMDPKNWTKNFEAIDEYFRGTRGHKKHPLKYVYRDLLVPPLATVDPQTGVVGSTHFSHDDEMIVQGPILLAGAVVCPDAETLGPFASSFLVDRAEVWGLHGHQGREEDPERSTHLPTVVQALSWAQQRW